MSVNFRLGDTDSAAKSFAEMDDAPLQAAVSQIYRDFGDVVDLKSKSLNKFGRTANADSGVATTVAEQQAASVVNETFATSNSIDSIVSATNSDTQSITIEGHYLSGSNLVFTVQTVALTGQTPATLTTSLMRATRLYNSTAGSLTSAKVAAPGGPVYCYDSTEATGTTAGVPDVAAATKIMIAAGANQSKKASTSISYRDYYIITQAGIACTKGNASTVSVDAEIEVSTDGGAWLPLGLELDARSGAMQKDHSDFYPFFIVPPNSDIRLVATSNTNDTEVNGFFRGHLALIRTDPA